jgi:hypothetical protein
VRILSRECGITATDWPDSADKNGDASSRCWLSSTHCDRTRPGAASSDREAEEKVTYGHTAVRSDSAGARSSSQPHSSSMAQRSPLPPLPAPGLVGGTVEFTREGKMKVTHKGKEPKEGTYKSMATSSTSPSTRKARRSIPSGSSERRSFSQFDGPCGGVDVKQPIVPFQPLLAQVLPSPHGESDFCFGRPIRSVACPQVRPGV